MKDAVIVSAVRTPVGRGIKGTSPTPAPTIWPPWS